ncbi:NUDIX domain-containing protein [Amycolatopsis sp. SID8362]|uniref:NUDIX hydrolase n=1 Tax=Amycolatopsis sp. SID8362 TaxID=2690346 RepID=UPI00136E2E45|nr:NUDIX domain-containing protein [Amycolatopsis sp. SID8362]NBH02929.1 NUDIX domain-containing protein [Amycolatopsis sp. SID8362]NED39630.1 NUDIX domain-containing protein [Amycolatopsis sp. SID8362]
MIDKVAWVHVVDGRVLAARSRDKDKFYLPGGKREPGESDTETLVREIREELDVEITPSTIAPAGTFEGQAHGKAPGTLVRTTAYTAEYTGTLKASSEIEEIAWLTHADRPRISLVAQLIFAHLRETGQLR